MKSDSQIKSAVLAELKRDPAIDETDMGVLVDQGVVTLTGHLNTFAEKFAAERAARRVEGVRAIAVKLNVNIPNAHKSGDSDTAQEMTSELRWNSLALDEEFKVEVEKDWVTLTRMVTLQ